MAAIRLYPLQSSIAPPPPPPPNHSHNNLQLTIISTNIMNLLLVNFLAWALVASFGAHAQEEQSSSLRHGSDSRSLQASGGGNTIDCVYRNSWPSTLTPAQACTALNDPTHPVPYKCATSGQRLCCTVSNLTTATFGSFGKCTKVGAAVPTTPTPPTPKPPTRKPTRKPTKKPAISSNISAPTKKPASSPTTPAGTNNIDCAWYSYFKDYTPVAACKKLNDPTHPVPYVCLDGRKVCCTVSSYSTTTMANFGKCTKV